MHRIQDVNSVEKVGFGSLSKPSFYMHTKSDNKNGIDIGKLL